MYLFFLRYRHNEDGSYTYGYEGSDGSFKIETKTTTGEVSGKYGYVDDSGKLRVVEYGANKFGFQPAGDGITVPPPTLVELSREEEELEEQPAPRPVKRPSSGKPQKPMFSQQQQPQQQQQPMPVQNAVRPFAADFDEGGSAGWTVQSKPTRPQSSISASRPAKSPPVSGAFRPVPVEQEDGPSGSYQTVQNFGGRSQASGARPAPVSHSYQTFEDQEPLTEQPAFFQAAPVAKPARRNNVVSPVNYRSAPRQMRTGGVLDQLAEQYALPKSGSPESHNFSFGSDS